MPLRSNKSRSPFHLLLVEDEFADAELFTELINETSGGIVVHHVSNGQEALRFLAREGGHLQAPSPDLIVLDLNMPVMSGLEFLKRAKNDDRARAIPVLENTWAFFCNSVSNLPLQIIDIEAIAGKAPAIGDRKSVV